MIASWFMWSPGSDLSLVAHSKTDRQPRQLLTKPCVIARRRKVRSDHKKPSIERKKHMDLLSFHRKQLFIKFKSSATELQDCRHLSQTLFHVFPYIQSNTTPPSVEPQDHILDVGGSLPKWHEDNGRNKNLLNLLNLQHNKYGEIASFLFFCFESV